MFLANFCGICIFHSNNPTYIEVSQVIVTKFDNLLLSLMPSCETFYLISHSISTSLVYISLDALTPQVGIVAF